MCGWPLQKGNVVFNALFIGSHHEIPKKYLKKNPHLKVPTGEEKCNSKQINITVDSRRASKKGWTSPDRIPLFI